MRRKILYAVICLFTLLLFFTGCTPATSPGPTLPAPTSANAVAQPSSPNPIDVTVVMGYIPNIQFAPFYVAEKKGYFAQEGLRVKFSWGFEIDGVKLLGANQTDFAMLGGDQVIQARAQGIPVVYVANYYNAFPITIFSLKEKNIRTPKDLVGKRVGLPALWGATYSGWRALLYGAGVKEADVQVQDIGFSQVAALTQGAVDAAAGYSNNEPVQLALVGKELNLIKVGDYSKLVGMGLVTNEKSVADRPQVVQKMVRALTRGIQDTLQDPKGALTVSLESLPEAGGANLKTTQAVLESTQDLWKNPRIGYVDPADWNASLKFMKDAGFIKTDIDISKAYTNTYVP